MSKSMLDLWTTPPEAMTLVELMIWCTQACFWMEKYNESHPGPTPGQEELYNKHQRAFVRIRLMDVRRCRAICYSNIRAINGNPRFLKAFMMSDRNSNKTIKCLKQMGLGFMYYRLGKLNQRLARIKSRITEDL